MTKKVYTKEICNSEFLLREAQTVQTFGGVIYVNLWNGQFISLANHTKITVSALYNLTRSVVQNGKIVASRSTKKAELRFLTKPIKIKKRSISWIN